MCNGKWDVTSWKKCGYFILAQLLSLLLAIGVLAFAFAKSSGLVLLTMPVLVGGCALIGFGLWLWRFKNMFESILVYITSASLLFAFLRAIMLNFLGLLLWQLSLGQLMELVNMLTIKKHRQKTPKMVSSMKLPWQCLIPRLRTAVKERVLCPLFFVFLRHKCWNAFN